jgi:hypothetical protein
MSVQFCEKENWDSNRNESFFYFKLEGCFRFGWVDLCNVCLNGVFLGNPLSRIESWFLLVFMIGSFGEKKYIFIYVIGDWGRLVLSLYWKPSRTDEEYTSSSEDFWTGKCCSDKSSSWSFTISETIQTWLQTYLLGLKNCSDTKERCLDMSSSWSIEILFVEKSRW